MYQVCTVEIHRLAGMLGTGTGDLMNKLILALSLGLAAYGSPLTYTTTCTPFSGPAVTVVDGGCIGSGATLTSSQTAFSARFDLHPDYTPPAYTGGCLNPIFGSGCGTTSMAASFSDDLYFNQTGFATFFLDEAVSIPSGSPTGFPQGFIDGQQWADTIITVPVGPGQPVHIALAANWTGSCCVGGGDNASVEFDILKIQFTDSNGNVSPSIYGSADGLLYPVVDGVMVLEPASVFLCALGLGLLVLRGRKFMVPRSGEAVRILKLS